MPSDGAETDNGFKSLAGDSASAALACIGVFAYAIHRNGPWVKGSVLVAVGTSIVIAETAIYDKVEILGHPSLVANFDSLVNSIVTGIDEFVIRYCWVHEIPCRSECRTVEVIGTDIGRRYILVVTAHAVAADLVDVEELRAALGTFENDSDGTEYFCCVFPRQIPGAFFKVAPFEVHDIVLVVVFDFGQSHFCSSEVFGALAF